MLTASLPLFIYSYNAFKHCIVNMYNTSARNNTHTARNDKLETIYFCTNTCRKENIYVSLRKSDNAIRLAN